jgi:hypothetical protein
VLMNAKFNIDITTQSIISNNHPLSRTPASISITFANRMFE